VREPFAPQLWSGVRHVPNTLGAVVPAGGSAADLECVRAIEQAILDEGPESVAMVIAEPVQNARGALVPPEGYWSELRRICDRYGVLLCADEVITSFGRVGHWFASARFGAEPDMITFAKGVTSAYLPLGGVVTRPSVVETIYDSTLGSFVHGATFGAHPVVTAVAVANIEAMRSEHVLDNVLAKQDGLGRRLREVAAGRRVVKEVRGTGFLHYLELMADSAAGRDLSADEHAELQGGVLAAFLREAALAVRPDGRGGTLIPVAPPLICDDATLDELASRLDHVLSRTESWLDGRK
jgi:adenosylmethionine-8-amino-7-oxononanoate aminotransferase